MDDTYKILIAAAVGFAVAPLSDLLKSKVSSHLTKKRLSTKLKLSIRILETSIPTLNETAKNREIYIKTGYRQVKPATFINPSFSLPKIETDIENCYSILSENEKELLHRALPFNEHIKNLEDKIAKYQDNYRDFTHEKYTVRKEDVWRSTLKTEANNSYKRILSVEKALLYTVICLHEILKKAISDSPQLLTNEEILRKSEIDLGIKLDLSWWSIPDSPYAVIDFDSDPLLGEDDENQESSVPSTI